MEYSQSLLNRSLRKRTENVKGSKQEKKIPQTRRKTQVFILEEQTSCWRGWRKKTNSKPYPGQEFPTPEDTETISRATRDPIRLPRNEKDSRCHQAWQPFWVSEDTETKFSGKHRFDSGYLYQTNQAWGQNQIFSHMPGFHWPPKHPHWKELLEDWFIQKEKLIIKHKAIHT